MLRKCSIFVLLFCFVSGIVLAQDRKATPKPGEGLYSFLVRNKLPVKKYKQKFIELNKGKFGKNNTLLRGVSYILPNKKSKIIKQPLFGKKYGTFKQKTSDLAGAVFYLVSGHGGPDPGAIGHYNGKTLHEDEYAYDVNLRLARNLLENGAKVYILIQDKKDGIRDDAILGTSKRETCMGRKIPLSQLKRLKQRTLDVFFYHHPKSRKGKRLTDQLSATFTEKYGKYQPNRGYDGVVKSRELYIVRKSTPPIAYVELGNIQNKQDQQRFVKANNRQALANWLYEGILKDFQKK